MQLRHLSYIDPLQLIVAEYFINLLNFGHLY